MSDENKTPAAAETPDQANALLPLVTAAAAIVAALIAIISFVLLISVSNDVARLQSQVRKLSNTVKSMEEEMGQIKASAATPAPSAERRPAAPPQPSHIDAGDPAQDCIVRAGSKNPLAGCLK
jgi:outer membrane murein-binding lipoprotein Lpp